jgi:two-component system, NarL family, response regulator DevR
MGLDLRIGLIDGDEDIRFGRRQIIDSQNDLKVVLEDGTYETALERAPEALIDVLVIDHRLRGGDGMSLSRDLIQKYLADDSKFPAIIMTGPYFSDELKLASMRAGASELVTQDARPEALLRAIRSTAAKDDQPDYVALRDFLDRMEHSKIASPEFLMKLGDLTEKEKWVLDLFASGISQDEVAAELDAPKYRVRQILQSAQRKCGFATLSQLFIALYEAGLLHV